MVQSSLGMVEVKYGVESMMLWVYLQNNFDIVIFFEMVDQKQNNPSMTILVPVPKPCGKPLR